jgi:hypothetical protein
VIRSGLYEAEVTYGQETCRLLVEMDHAPSNDAVPPHISMHMIGCTPRPAIRNATATRKVAGEGAAASRRLLQVAGGAGAVAPSVEVLNMSVMAPEVIFITTNRTGQVLASFVSLAIAPANAGPSPCYWLIAAPESVAIGAFPPTHRLPCAVEPWHLLTQRALPHWCDSATLTPARSSGSGPTSCPAEGREIVWSAPMERNALRRGRHPARAGRSLSSGEQGVLGVLGDRRSGAVQCVQAGGGAAYDVPRWAVLYGAV